MRRINYLQKTDFDLSDLEQKSIQLIKTVNEKMDELDRLAPQIGVREYLRRIADDFTETPFNPLDDFWESKLRKILGDNDALPPPDPEDTPDHQTDDDQPED